MTIRVGLIGAGAIGLVHLEGFNKNENCELVAIASRTDEHTKYAAQKYNIPNFYVGDGWKDMLKEENLDVLSICTPNYLHTPNILEALDNNIHILCEKPICISRKELVKIETELHKKDVIFFTAFHKRYISFLPLIKKVIEDNIIGKVIVTRYYFAHLGPYISHNAVSKEKWFFDSQKAGGGVLLDLGVHAIDVLRYLIDEYDKVEAINYSTSCVNMAEEDTCNVLFRFKNNALGIITTSWCNEPTEIIEIFGTKGIIKVDLISQKPFSIIPDGLRNNPLVETAVKLEPNEEILHHSLINHFIDCVSKNKQENPNFVDGKKAVEFIFDAYKFK